MTGETKVPLLRLTLVLAVIAAVIAALRIFMKGWLDPLGVPIWLGSLVASTWVLLGVALLLMFVRSGQHPQGRYLRTAFHFVPLAAWCETLVIGGILLTDKLGWDTYYCGPFDSVRDNFPTAAEHAIGHTQGFVVRAVLWCILAGIVYAVARRKRT